MKNGSSTILWSVLLGIVIGSWGWGTGTKADPEVSAPTPLTLMQLGEQYRDAGKLELANEMWHTVETLHPDSPNADEALLFQSLSYEADGQPERAEELMQQLRERYPSSPYSSYSSP